MRTSTIIISILFILPIFNSCTSSSSHENIPQESKDSIFQTQSSWVEKSLKKAEGTWIKLNSESNNDYFTIHNDTLINQRNDSYRIILTNDSLWTTYQLLDSLESIRFKPSVGSQHLFKVTSDSLIFWNWEFGKKHYSVYSKKQ